MGHSQEHFYLEPHCSIVIPKVLPSHISRILAHHMSFLPAGLQHASLCKSETHSIELCPCLAKCILRHADLPNCNACRNTTSTRRMRRRRCDNEHGAHLHR